MFSVIIQKTISIMKKAIERMWSAAFFAALICCGTSFASNTPQKAEKSSVEKVAKNTFRYVTSDLLSWEGKFFWMSKTPLSTLKGYRDLYNQQHPGDFDKPLKVMTPPLDKRFTAIWTIDGNKLYMKNIKMEGRTTATENTFYPKDSVMRTMEHFTHEKFIPNPKDSVPYLFAKWFTGEIYVKSEFVKKFNDNSQTVFQEWEKLPYYALTFKEGELISKTLINTSENGK